MLDDHVFPGEGYFTFLAFALLWHVRKRLDLFDSTLMYC